MSLEHAQAEAAYEHYLADELTAEKIYQRQWVLRLLKRTMDRLAAECAQDGQAQLFEQLKPALTESLSASDYQNCAGLLDMSPNAVKQAAYRLRTRFREMFRQEVGRTLDADSNLDEEIGYLLDAFSR